MKKNISVFLAAVTLGLTLGGCGGGNGNSNSTQTTPPEMPTYETTETFRIGNWGTPYHANSGYMEYANNPDYCTEEHWTNFKNCGYNLAIPTYGVNSTSVEAIKRDLEMAEKVGMKVLVRDNTSAGLEGIIKTAGDRGYGYEETKEMIESREDAIKANIDQYKQYDSFIGVNGYDEPSMDYYEPISACQDWFLKNYPEYEFYTNLLPVYATPKQLYGRKSGTGLAYPDYVSEYVKEVNPAMLSYDHYPILQDWDESAYVKDDFLYNLNVFALQSKKTGAPVQIYLQTMGFFNNLPITRYEEFAWQCYTSLAFGVRGIMTFQYWTQLQAEYHNNVRGGIVDRDGTITPLYYEVQKVFNEIVAMQDVYLNFKWDGIKTYLGGRVMNNMFIPITNQLENLNDITEVETDQDIIIGQFKDNDGQYAYMVTNAVSPFERKSVNVSLTFGNGYNYVLLVKKGTREIVKLENKVLEMEVGAGEGYFVVPLK